MQPFLSLCEGSGTGFKRCFPVCLGRFQLAFLQRGYAFVGLLTVFSTAVFLADFIKTACAVKVAVSHMPCHLQVQLIPSEEIPQNLQTAQVRAVWFQSTLRHDSGSISDCPLCAHFHLLFQRQGEPALKEKDYF